MKGSAMLAVQACALALAVLVATPGVAQERALTADGQNFIMQRMERRNLQAFDRQAHRPMSHARVCSAAAQAGNASCHAHIVNDETGRPFATKPTWQKDTGCAKRTVADISAVADPNTGVAVFGPSGRGNRSAWLVFGGTSVFE
jgi:hypothetical protein